MQEIYSQALKRAAEILGGEEALRDLLQVPMHRLEPWLSGHETPPMGIFLKAVDVISSSPEPMTRAMQRSPQAVAEPGIRTRADEAAQRASEMHASILSVPSPFPGARKPRSVLAFLHESFRPGEGRAMIEWALDAAVEGTGADMGNIQLARPDGLVIVAQRGFDPTFLEFFACVRREGSCGAARHLADRVVVADVQSDPIFVGTDAAEVMEHARARACQSTPLIGASGEVLGVLSTHYEKPRRPSEQEFQVLNHIAARATFWLDGGSG
jgi:GAF domain-containing protein